LLLVPTSNHNAYKEDLAVTGDRHLAPSIRVFGERLRSEAGSIKSNIFFEVKYGEDYFTIMEKDLNNLLKAVQ
jgi:hypothetical protein